MSHPQRPQRTTHTVAATLDGESSSPSHGVERIVRTEGAHRDDHDWMGPELLRMVDIHPPPAPCWIGTGCVRPDDRIPSISGAVVGGRHRSDRGRTASPAVQPHPGRAQATCDGWCARPDHDGYLSVTAVVAYPRSSQPDVIVRFMREHCSATQFVQRYNRRDFEGQQPRLIVYEPVLYCAGWPSLAASTRTTSPATPPADLNVCEVLWTDGPSEWNGESSLSDVRVEPVWTLCCVQPLTPLHTWLFAAVRSLQLPRCDTLRIQSWPDVNDASQGRSTFHRLKSLRIGMGAEAAFAVDPRDPYGYRDAQREAQLIAIVAVRDDARACVALLLLAVRHIGDLWPVLTTVWVSEASQQCAPLSLQARTGYYAFARQAVRRYLVAPNVPPFAETPRLV